ncbi:MAG: hypothetical protein ACD_73C00104G0001 [uncultured bacterium]|nr:MAG: hypothetical protein ACD_73C00104G0001 [uncultured bacterium]
MGKYFSHLDDLVVAMKKDLLSGDAILVKGSRGAKMERVIDALLTKGEV